MKKNSRIFWICQIAGWSAYALTVVFFAYLLERQLSDVFLKRIIISIVFGIITTALLRKAIIVNNLRPPTPAKQWWKMLALLILTICLFGLATGSFIEFFRLFEVGRENPKPVDNQFVFSLPEIIKSWSGARVAKRFLFSLIFDTPIFFVWISIYVLWHYIEFANSQAINKVKLENIIKELELKTIKSQINPHFIFNALNSIRALVDENPQRARQAITELSNILRSSIQVDKVEVTTLEKELAIVKDYLALEYIRFADRLKVEYEIDSETVDNHLPPMMLQTLVENAIKHGLGKQPGDCLIKIVSKFDQQKHVLKVINTGILASNEKDGFGLQSTRERLNLLYRGEALFEIYQCQTNQVTAKLVIPIQSLLN